MTLRWDREAGPPGQHTVAFGLLALSALAAARFFPFHLFPLACPLRHGAGIPCLTCGMTTAMTAAARGDLGRALAANPLGVVLLVSCVLVAAYAAARFLGLPALRAEAGPRGARALRWAALAAVAANWIFVWSPWR